MFRDIIYITFDQKNKNNAVPKYELIFNNEMNHSIMSYFGYMVIFKSYKI